MQDVSRSPPSTVLLTVRLWEEPLDESRSEWRGAVKNLSTGETRSLRQWDELTARVPRMLSGGCRDDR